MGGVSVDFIRDHLSDRVFESAHVELIDYARQIEISFHIPTRGKRMGFRMPLPITYVDLLEIEGVAKIFVQAADGSIRPKMIVAALSELVRYEPAA
jgi:hypothetical protein